MPFIEKSLQNECGGHLIDHAPVLLACSAGIIEDLVGLVGRQALVAKVDGQAGERAQFGGKGAGLGGLRAFFAGEVQRQAYNDTGSVETACEAGERAQVFPPIPPSFERKHGLRGDAQLVRCSYTDAAIADIETEKPRVRVLAQRFSPGIQA